MPKDLADVRPMQHPAKVNESVDAVGNSLSPWIDGASLPLAVGPYQRRRLSDGKHLGYSQWSGSAWMYAAIDPGLAIGIDAMESDYQAGGGFEWRGVVANAKLH